MKKWIAILSVCSMLFAFAACGSKEPAKPEAADGSTAAATTEVVTADPATQPEVGRVAEKDAFYVYVPEDWCRMEYAGNGLRIRLFDIPSAPDIKDGETPEIEIAAVDGNIKKTDVEAEIAKLMKNEGAKEGKAGKIDGENFSTVSYKVKDDKRTHIAYVGIAGGKLVTVTMKGITMADEDAAAIMRSISFKK